MHVRWHRTAHGELLVTITENIDYDKEGQLTSNSDSGESYSYDENGNRDNTGYAYSDPNDPNRVTSDGTYTYTYDNEGNLEERVKGTESHSFTWDHRNRLKSVLKQDSAIGTSATRQISYEYDAYDNRVSKLVENFTGTDLFEEFYVYNQGQLEVVLDDSGDVIRRYMNGPGVDQVLAEEVYSNGVWQEVNWFLTDHQGTVRDVVSDGGTNQKFEYDSFGNLTSGSSPRIGYASREFDSDTGLYNNRARWYSPEMGRFISEDPIGFAAGDTNLYRYVGNSPVNYTDPSGLYAIGAALGLDSTPIAGLGGRVDVANVLSADRSQSLSFDDVSAVIDIWSSDYRSSSVVPKIAGLSTRTRMLRELGGVRLLRGIESGANFVQEYLPQLPNQSPSDKVGSFVFTTLAGAIEHTTGTAASLFEGNFGNAAIRQPAFFAGAVANSTPLNTRSGIEFAGYQGLSRLENGRWLDNNELSAMSQMSPRFSSIALQHNLRTFGNAVHADAARAGQNAAPLLEAPLEVWTAGSLRSARLGQGTRRLFAPNRGAFRIRATNVGNTADTVTARQIGAGIANDPVASRAYLQVRDRVGADVVLDFGRPPVPGATGRVQNLGRIEIFGRNLDNVQEGVSTFVHESRHLSDIQRGISNPFRPTQLDEFRAFRREFLSTHGRRPTLGERQVIRQQVEQIYPNLPVGR